MWFRTLVKVDSKRNFARSVIAKFFAKSKRDRSGARPLENADSGIAEAAGVGRSGSKRCKVEVLSVPSTAVCF